MLSMGLMHTAPHPHSSKVLENIRGNFCDNEQAAAALVQICWAGLNLPPNFEIYIPDQPSTDSNGSRNTFFGPETFRKLTER